MLYNVLMGACICAALPVWTGFAQTNTDSLANLLIVPMDPGQRFHVLIELAHELEQNHPDSALTYIDEARKMAEGSGSAEQKIHCLIEKAHVHKYQSNHEKSLSGYLEALTLAQEHDNLQLLARIQSGLSDRYIALGANDKAKTYLDASLSNFEAVNDPVGMEESLTGLGRYFQITGDFEQALAYYDKALNLATPEEHVYNKCRILNNKASIYADELKQYPKAIGHLKKALAIAGQLDKKWTAALLCNNLSQLYYITGKYDSSMVYVKEAVALNASVNNPYLHANSLKYLSLNKSTKGQNREALHDMNELILLYDSLSTRDLLEQIAQKDVEFETVKKQADIEHLEAENQYRSEQVQLALIALAITIALALILIIQYRNKHRAYKALLQKNMAFANSELYRHYQSTGYRDVPEEKKYTGSSITDIGKQEIYYQMIHKLEKEEIFLEKDISLYSLARHLNSNVSYVSQVINEQFGGNFNQVINEYRIKKAMQLLSDPGNTATLEEIALEVGFNSSQVFNRAFKKITGLTPSYFRKSTMKQLEEVKSRSVT